MPDATMKKLLVKIGINSQDWKKLVAEIKQDLKGVQEQAKAHAQQQDALTKQEIARQKEKQKVAAEEIQWMEKKIKAIQRTLDVQELEVNQKKQLITDAKNLVALEESTIGLLAKQKEFHDVDLSKLREKIALRKSELSVQEAQFRYEAGHAGVGQPAAAGAMGAARLAQLQTNLQKATFGKAEGGLRTEMALQTELYRSGEMKATQYTAKQIELRNQLHTVIMARLQQEKIAAEAMGQIQIRTGKLAVDEEKMVTKAILEQIQLREIKEQGEYERELQRLRNIGKVPTLLERVHTGFEGVEKGKGLLPSILGGVAGIGMGGGVLGTLGGIAGGMVGPEGALGGSVLGMVLQRAIDSLIEKFDQLSEHIEEATGRETQLRVEFEKLGKGIGANTDDFLTRLRTVSHGLADNAQLYQIANNFMRLGMKMTSDQIVDLTRVTVDLSRASGKTAEEGIQSLINASRTGYLRTLAFTTGISLAAMRLRGLSATIDPVKRQQLELAQYMKLANDQLRAMGTPMVTLPEVVKIYHTQVAELVHDFASSMASTKGFGMAMTEIASAIMEAKEAVTPFIEEVGKRFGQALYLIAPTIRAITVAMQGFAAAVRLAVEVVPGLKNALMPSEFKGFVDMIGRMAIVMDQWTLKTRLQTLRLEELLAVLKAVKNLDLGKIQDIRVEFAKKKIEALSEFQQNFNRDMSLTQEGEKGSKVDLLGDQTALKNELNKLQKEIDITRAKDKLQVFEQELDQEKTDLRQHYQEGLLTQEAFVQQQRQLNAQSHDAKLKEIGLERQAQINALEQEAEASQEDYRVTAKKRVLINEQTNLKIQEENLKFQREDEQLDDELIQSKVAARRKYIQAVLSVEMEGAEQRKKILEDELNEGEISPDQYLEKRKEIIDGELQLKLAQYQQEYDASAKSAQSEADFAIKSIKAQEDAQKELTELTLKEDDIRFKSLTSRYDSTRKVLQGAIQLGQEQAGVGILGGQAAQESAIKQLKEFNDEYIKQLEIQQEKVKAGGTTWLKITSAIQQAQIEQIKLNQEMAKMKDILTPIGGLLGEIANQISGITSQQGRNWHNVMSQVAKQFELIGKLQQEQAAAGGQSMMRGLFGSFRQMIHRGGTVGTATAKLSPEEIFKQRLQESDPLMNRFNVLVNQSTLALQKFIGALGMTAPEQPGGKVFGPPDVTKIGKASTPFLPETSNTSLLNTLLPTPAQMTSGGLGVMTGMFTNLFGGLFGGTTATKTGTELPQAGTASFEQKVSELPLKSTSDALKTLNQSAMEAAGAKGGGLRNFTKQLSGFVGVVGGFANTVFGSKGTGSGIFGGILSGASTGAELGGGPIGAAIGAGIGGIMGGLVGSKQEAVTKNVERLNKAFDNVVKSLNMGAIGIGQALQQVQALRQQAIESLGGSKKGQKQLPAVLQTFDAEIQQLQAQIKKTINDMRTALAEMAAGPAWQNQISQIVSIMQQYQQFAQAAQGNTKQMADALEYLRLSLENYAETLNNDVRQANEQAIQDALDYNNLLEQRQNLINQEAQQEYQIMTQGVLTRQQNVAMTKMQEIANLRYNRDQQLDQLNQEIGLSKYKLEVEGKIFKLATTRVGLEMQLMALKEQDFNNQIAVTMADQSLIGKLMQVANSTSLLTALGQITAFGDPSHWLNRFLGSTLFGTPGHLTSNLPGTGFNPLIPTTQNIPTFPMNIVGGLVNSFLPGNTSGLAGLPGVAPAGNLSFTNPDIPTGISSNPVYVAPAPGMGWSAGGGSGFTGGRLRMAAYQHGGVVPETEVALVHRGEAVFPENIVTKFSKMLNTVTTASPFSSVFGPVINGKPVTLPETPTNPARVTAEQQIHGIATSRVAMESKVLQVRRQILQMEMQHMAMLQSVLASAGVGNKASLEQYMTDLYQVRGRYGSGGFYKEYL